MTVAGDDAERPQPLTLVAFREAQEMWGEAIRGHRTAPPDGAFSLRLEQLAAAAHFHAEICRAAHQEGYKWPPHTGTPQPPWELTPESGRRGPPELWREFDDAVAALGVAARGVDLLAVAAAFASIASAADTLAKLVGQVDHRMGIVPRSLDSMFP